MSFIGWSPLLAVLIFQIPFAIIYVVGIILSIVRWRQHPRVSMLCLLAFISFLSTILIHSGMQIFLMASVGREIPSSTTVLFILGLLNSVLSVLGWVLLIPAIFGWRSPR